MPKEKVDAFVQDWAAREFGAQHADRIARTVSKYAKYNGWRKPELLEPGTFSLVHYQEAERVLAAWQEIVVDAEQMHSLLAPRYRDAFYQLVLYPTKASATVVEMYIAAGRNRLYAAQGRASANEQAQRVRDLFLQDQALSDSYHQLADGKWNHMMAQTRIGYTSWDDPDTNIMPVVRELEVPAAARMGVAIEGSEAAWPGGPWPAVLPAFDSLNRQERWIDVFRRGAQEFPFTVTASHAWVELSATSGVVDEDQRLWVAIDWETIPVGEHRAEIILSGPGQTSVTLRLTAVRSADFTPETVDALGGLTGPIAFAAESAARSIPVGGVRWERIPDYGRGKSGMAIFPVTAESVMPPEPSPRLEYPVLIAEAGDIRVELITGIALNTQPDRGVRIAVSFNEHPPQILDAFDGQAYDDPSERPDPSAPPIIDWHTWVRDNVRTLTSTHRIPEPGVHTLKVRMVDPGTVLEKIVVSRGYYPGSYFGPPTRHDAPAGE
jgi:hypothetical protein